MRAKLVLPLLWAAAAPQEQSSSSPGETGSSSLPSLTSNVSSQLETFEPPQDSSGVPPTFPTPPSEDGQRPNFDFPGFDDGREDSFDIPENVRSTYPFNPQPIFEPSFQPFVPLPPIPAFIFSDDPRMVLGGVARLIQQNFEIVDDIKLENDTSLELEFCSFVKNEPRIQNVLTSFGLFDQNRDPVVCQCLQGGQVNCEALNSPQDRSFASDTVNECRISPETFDASFEDFVCIRDVVIVPLFDVINPDITLSDEDLESASYIFRSATEALAQAAQTLNPVEVADHLNRNIWNDPREAIFSAGIPIPFDPQIIPTQVPGEIANAPGFREASVIANGPLPTQAVNGELFVSISQGALPAEIFTLLPTEVQSVLSGPLATQISTGEILTFLEQGQLPPEVLSLLPPEVLSTLVIPAATDIFPTGIPTDPLELLPNPTALPSNPRDILNLLPGNVGEQIPPLASQLPNVPPGFFEGTLPELPVPIPTDLPSNLGDVVPPNIVTEIGGLPTNVLDGVRNLPIPDNGPNSIFDQIATLPPPFDQLGFGPFVSAPNITVFNNAAQQSQTISICQYLANRERIQQEFPDTNFQQIEQEVRGCQCSSDLRGIRCIARNVFNAPLDLVLKPFPEPSLLPNPNFPVCAYMDNPLAFMIQLPQADFGPINAHLRGCDCAVDTSIWCQRNNFVPSFNPCDYIENPQNFRRVFPNLDFEEIERNLRGCTCTPDRIVQCPNTPDPVDPNQPGGVPFNPCEYLADRQRYREEYPNQPFDDYDKQLEGCECDGDILFCNGKRVDELPEVETPRYQPPPKEFDVPLYAEIVGPAVFGGCDNSNVYVDGGLSQGYWPLTYTWSIANSQDPAVTLLQSKLAQSNQRNSAFIKANAGIFPVGTPVTVVLSIRDARGRVAQSSLIMTRVDALLPQVFIMGPSTMSVSAGRTAEIYAEAKIPQCEGSRSPLTFEWGLNIADTNTAVNLPNFVRTDMRRLVIPGSVLSSGAFDATLKVYRAADVEDVSKHVTKTVRIVVAQGPIYAEIAGGSRSEGVGREIVLDASYPWSYDSTTPAIEPANFEFEWTCQDLGTGLRLDQSTGRTGTTGTCPFTSANGAQIRVHSPDNTQGVALTAGNLYNFTVTATEGQRSSTDSVAILAVESTPPQIQIYQLFPNGVAQSQSALALKANSTDAAESERITWAWSSLDNDGTFNSLDLTDSSVARIVRGLLIVNKDQLISGGSYRFQVVATSDTGTATSFIDVPVNRAPFGGSVSGISNSTESSSGTAFVDTWTIAASDWLDDQTDFALRYRFSTKDANGRETSLGMPSVNPTIETILGARVAQVCVVVEDSYLARGETCTDVTVTRAEQNAAQKRALADELIEGELTRLLEEGDIGSAFAAVNSIMDLVSTDEETSEEDATVLVEQQKRAISAVQDLVSSSGPVDATVASAALSAIGQVSADKLPAQDLADTLQFMSTLVQGTTTPPSYASETSATVSMDIETAQQVGGFLGLALQSSASAQVNTLISTLRKRGLMAQEASTEDQILTLIDDSAKAMVNDLQCGESASTLRMNSTSFEMQVNKFSPSTEGIAFRTIIVGDMVATIPTTDIGTDCLVVQAVQFNTTVYDSANTALNLASNVFQSKLFDIESGSQVDSTSASISVVISGNYANGDGTANAGKEPQCKYYDGQEWKSEGCTTTKNSDTEVTCRCPYHAQQAVAMQSSAARAVLSISLLVLMAFLVL